MTEPAEKKEALKKWQESLGVQKAAEVSKKATDHGTNVHLLTERFLKGEDPLAPIGGKPVPFDDINAFNALKLLLKKIDEVWGQEVPLYSTSLEVCGRCDFVGIYKGRPVIVDFKTSSRIKSKSDIHSYKLQLAFYAKAHNEMFGTDIQEGVILMVAETGFPMEFIVKLSEVETELRERCAAFWSASINNAV